MIIFFFLLSWEKLLEIKILSEPPLIFKKNPVFFLPNREQLTRLVFLIAVFTLQLILYALDRCQNLIFILNSHIKLSPNVFFKDNLVTQSLATSPVQDSVLSVDVTNLVVFEK